MKISLIVLFFAHANAFFPQDARLRTPDLLRKYGYPCETHEVITDDDYILTHFRIPYGKTSSITVNKPVVLLHHCLLGSSAYYLLKTPTHALAYKLADAGFDVWLMNTRGNEHSNRHTKWNPIFDHRQFYNFSYHELGMYDLPNTIDYVLNKTGQSKLFHIGHSMGTTSFYVMLSEKPQYNDKVLAHVSLSPVAFNKHVTSVMFRAGAPFEKFYMLTALRTYLGDFNFIPSSQFLRIVTSVFCADGMFTQALCLAVYYGLFGYNPAQMNTTMLPIIFGHFPVGASFKQSVHYIQGLNSDQFMQYDYSYVGNLAAYEQGSPPKYKFENMRTPIYTFYGEKDALAPAIDVRKLHSFLPNLKNATNLGAWAHFDYVFANDVNAKVNEPILNILKQYL